MKKLWITGERGMLGTLLRESLEVGTTPHGKKEYEVVNFKPEWLSKVSVHHEHLEFDVASELILPAMRTISPDVVVHFAAVVNTDKCQANPQQCIRTNLEGTRNVLQACKESGARLIYISTTATYNPHLCVPSIGYDEGHEQNPGTIYGITKYAGELLVRNQMDVPWIVIRPCFLLGTPPLDHSSQLCRVAMHSVMKKICPIYAGPTPIVTLNLENKKDYMPVMDFIGGIRRLLLLWDGNRNIFDRRIFNISGMHPQRTLKYFNALQSQLKLLGTEMQMQWCGKDDYLGDHLVNSNKFRRLTGWEPTHDVWAQIKDIATCSYDYVSKELNRDGGARFTYR